MPQQTQALPPGFEEVSLTPSLIDEEAKKFGLSKTSGFRTPSHNKAVGGVSNSDHLRGEAGDYVGAKQKEFYKHLRDNYGVKVLDEGDHIHAQAKGIPEGFEAIPPEVKGKAISQLAQPPAQPSESTVDDKALKFLQSLKAPSDLIPKPKLSTKSQSVTGGLPPAPRQPNKALSDSMDYVSGIAEKLMIPTTSESLAHIKNLASRTLEMWTKPGKFIYDPSLLGETLPGEFAKMQYSPLQKAEEIRKEKGLSVVEGWLDPEVLGHSGLSLIPFIGPFASQFSTEVKQGDFKAASQTAIVMAIPFLHSKLKALKDSGRVKGIKIEPSESEPVTSFEDSTKTIYINPTKIEEAIREGRNPAALIDEGISHEVGHAMVDKPSQGEKTLLKQSAAKVLSKDNAEKFSKEIDKPGEVGRTTSKTAYENEEKVVEDITTTGNALKKVREEETSNSPQLGREISLIGKFYWSDPNAKLPREVIGVHEKGGLTYLEFKDLNTGKTGVHGVNSKYNLFDSIKEAQKSREPSPAFGRSIDIEGENVPNTTPIRGYRAIKIGDEPFPIGYTGQLRGVYLSANENAAKEYLPSKGRNSKIIQADVEITNPANEVDRQALEEELGDKYTPELATQMLIQRGFDGYISAGTGEGFAEIVAFDPKQVKASEGKSQHIKPHLDEHWRYTPEELKTLGYSDSSIPEGFENLPQAPSIEDTQSKIKNPTYTEEKPNVSNKIGEESSTAKVSDLSNLRGINNEHKFQSDSDPHIRDMADRMKRYGYKSNLLDSEPIIIYHLNNGDVFIGDGNRRVRAARLAGLDEVPIKVEYFGKPIEVKPLFGDIPQYDTTLAKDGPESPLDNLKSIKADIELGTSTLYHGTTEEIAAKIHAEGFRLPSTRELVESAYKAAGLSWESRKSIPIKVRNYIERELRGRMTSGIHGATESKGGAISFALSKKIAERWAGKGGEISHEMAARAREWKKAYDEGLRGSDEFFDYIDKQKDYRYEDLGEPAIVEAKGIITPQQQKWLSRDINRIIKAVEDKEISPEDGIQLWEETYRDIRLSPRDVKPISQGSGTFPQYDTTLAKGEPLPKVSRESDTLPPSPAEKAAQEALAGREDSRGQASPVESNPQIAPSTSAAWKEMNPTLLEGYGEANTIVPKSEYQSLVDKFKEKQKTQRGSGGPSTEDLADLVRIATFHLEAGARDFAAFSKSMISDIGEWIEPYLQDLYSQGKVSLAQKGSQPLKEGEGERSLPRTLEEQNLPGGTERFYDVSPNARTQARAEGIISEKGIDGAIEWVKASEVVSPEHTATGLSLINKLVESGEMEKAIDLASDLSVKLTKYGQAIQAVKIVEKLSPESVVMIAQKIVNKAKPGTTLAPEAATSLVKIATELKAEHEAIKHLESTLEKASDSEKVDILNNIDILREKVHQKRIELAKGYNDLDKWGKFRRELTSWFSLPRTIMASMDLSAAMRQGGVFSTAHPIVSAKAFIKQLEALSKNPENYRKFEERYLLSDPMYDEAATSGVSFTASDTSGLHDLSKAEEAFISNVVQRWAESPNKVKRLIAAPIARSEQAYVTFLNSQRLSVYKLYADGLRRQGMTPENAPYEYQAAADFINKATGRGDLGRYNSAAPLLSGGLFAPRWIASRFQLLNPTYYPNLPKPVRMMVAKDMVKFTGTVAATLTLAKLSGLGETSLNPDDPDFLKLVIGNTHYDLSAGFQGEVRYLFRILKYGTKELKGDLIKKGPYTIDKTTGRPTQTGLQITEDFVRRKLAPIPGMAASALSGESLEYNQATGKRKPFSLLREGSRMFTPLVINDIIEAAQIDQTKGALKALPTIVGIGTTTYKKRLR